MGVEEAVDRRGLPEMEAGEEAPAEVWGGGTCCGIGGFGWGRAPWGFGWWGGNGGFGWRVVAPRRERGTATRECPFAAPPDPGMSRDEEGAPRPLAKGRDEGA